MLFESIICLHENNQRPVSMKEGYRERKIGNNLIMLLVSQAWPVIDFVFLNIGTLVNNINKSIGFQ